MAIPLIDPLRDNVAAFRRHHDRLALVNNPFHASRLRAHAIVEPRLPPDSYQLSDERAERVIVVLHWGNVVARKKSLVCRHPHTLDIEQQSGLGQNQPTRSETLQFSQFAGIDWTAAAQIRSLPGTRTDCDCVDIYRGIFLFLLPSSGNPVKA